jgi:hypothetical protein
MASPCWFDQAANRIGSFAAVTRLKIPTLFIIDLLISDQPIEQVSV